MSQKIITRIVDKGATLETVFMEDNVTFPSSHLLQSLDNKIWKDTFKEDKLSCLTVDFRSLPEKPRWDKQDFTVVEQYPFVPTSIAKRWTDQLLKYLVSRISNFFLMPNLHVFLTGTYEFYNYAGLLRLWKNKYIFYVFPHKDMWVL